MTTKINLNSILVIDLESTCWEGGVIEGKTQKEESEIIELGVCEIKKDNGIYKIADKASIMVKPTKHPVLSEYCINLTSITQELIKEGQILDQALRTFNNRFSPKKKTLVAWGNYDIWQIKKECNEKGYMDSYNFSNTYINAKNLFALKHGLNKEVGLTEALKIAGMKFEGNQHRGVDDAYNTAKLFLTFLENRLSYGKSYE